MRPSHTKMASFSSVLAALSSRSADTALVGLHELESLLLHAGEDSRQPWAAAVVPLLAVVRRPGAPALHSTAVRLLAQLQG